MFAIFPIPAFHDNYIWALYHPQGACVIVDPGDAVPVEAFLQHNQLSLAALLITHHHADHTGGIKALTANRDIPVYGPGNENIPGLTHPLTHHDHIKLPGNLPACDVIAVPGHTLGHLAYFITALKPAVLFCGDTLFAGGCGRLFEGSPEQMLASLDRLAALPSDTRVCCAHEYTQSNLAFARAVEPDNAALIQRIKDVDSLRQQQQPSLPSTILEERTTNPFLRIDQPTVRAALPEQASRAERFAALRRWKDNF